MKAKRHAEILKIITEYVIDTQEELLKLLKKGGFNTTQATVSRDIKELRLVKTLMNGDYKYVVPNIVSDVENQPKYESILSESVQSIDYAGHTVVVKCGAGMAGAACAAIDSMDLKKVVGTLAGDDTVFILLRTESDAVEFSKGLLKYPTK